jgi:hypothetical protein
MAQAAPGRSPGLAPERRQRMNPVLAGGLDIQAVRSGALDGRRRKTGFVDARSGASSSDSTGSRK